MRCKMDTKPNLNFTSEQNYKIKYASDHKNTSTEQLNIKIYYSFYTTDFLAQCYDRHITKNKQNAKKYLRLNLDIKRKMYKPKLYTVYSGT